MTFIIQSYSWLSVVGACIIGIWIGGAFGLLGNGLCHSAKKGGDRW